MARCISCDGDHLTGTRNYRYYNKVFAGFFPDLTELECERCGLRQVDHATLRDGDLDRYYRDHYRQDVKIAQADRRFERAFLAARGQALAKLAARHKPVAANERIFELGAGYGVNLLEFGRKYTGAQLFSDDLNPGISPPELQPARIEDGPFEIILLSHVLEHIRNPRPVVASVVDNLAAGGLLVVEVPHEGSDFIYQVRDGVPFHEPHITFFSLETLASFFASNFPELRILHLGSAGPDYRAEQQNRSG